VEENGPLKFFSNPSSYQSLIAAGVTLDIYNRTAGIELFYHALADYSQYFWDAKSTTSAITQLPGNWKEQHIAAVGTSNYKQRMHNRFCTVRMRLHRFLFVKSEENKLDGGHRKRLAG
jgi:hypothetical protein